MIRTTKRNLARQRPGPQIDRRQASGQALGQTRTDRLGALAFRALARAFAWLRLVGRTDRSSGRAVGLVCGPDLGARASRAGAEVFPGRVRRDAGPTPRLSAGS